jgi:hypothetical protein
MHHAFIGSQDYSYLRRRDMIDFQEFMKCTMDPSETANSIVKFD